jgi:hypothetical protein
MSTVTTLKLKRVSPYAWISEFDVSVVVSPKQANPNVDSSDFVPVSASRLLNLHPL